VSTNAQHSTREKIPGNPGSFSRFADLARRGRESAWRDPAIIVGITAASVIVSARFNLNERLYQITRHWEQFQVDELPIGMLVPLICLMWLAWRRYQHARRELNARRIVEARLTEVLAENRELAQEKPAYPRDRA
jgi:hypothetical protein